MIIRVIIIIIIVVVVTSLSESANNLHATSILNLWMLMNILVVIDHMLILVDSII
ncbi:uncharacterized protein BX664DRAFT_338624 [Halteromyces radiatus]|uniref:uncharacterized protein n=1 Tax=Halteromyces radiatus TaxID=101107 RepID=UPI00221FE94D|nr:uncharacterized protein BX664DRAFT_338624 [Halteromyces radiatus]KAI8085146.1 hypothetical protein BX664DRAFT_338624 [Halteromyces radiatus]